MLQPKFFDSINYIRGTEHRETLRGKPSRAESSRDVGPSSLLKGGGYRLNAEVETCISSP